MKLNNFYVFVIAIALFTACSKENDGYNPEKQFTKDNEKLLTYLKTHYLNTNDGNIWTIGKAGKGALPKDKQKPLLGQVKTQNVTKDNFSYKLYYLVTKEGAGVSPTVKDSVLTTYTGMLLDSTIFDISKTKIWMPLPNVIDGWKHGFTNFKAGVKVVDEDEYFYYKDYGAGFLFIPSVLAYRDRVQRSIPKNSPLIFKITLQDVNKSKAENKSK